MVLVLGVKSEEVGLVPTDAGRHVVAVTVVIAHVGIERGIAMERLALVGIQSTIGQLAIVHQTLPSRRVQRCPVHTHGCQRCFVIAVQQLVDKSWGLVLTELQTYNGINVMLVIVETLVEVQLVAERIAIRVVSLLGIASATCQQTIAVLIDKRIMRHTHLIGIGIVILFTTVLRPLVLEHHIIFEPFQELSFQINERTDAHTTRVCQALVQRLQHVEAVGHQSWRTFHRTDARKVQGTTYITANVDIGRIHQIAVSILNTDIALLHGIAGIRAIGCRTIAQAGIHTKFHIQPFRQLKRTLIIHGESIRTVVHDAVLVVLVVERSKMVVATRLLRQRYIVTLGQRCTPHVVAILLVEVVLAPLAQGLVHLVSRDASFVAVAIQLIEGRIVVVLQLVEHQRHTTLVGHTVAVHLRLVIYDVACRGIVHLVKVRLGRYIPVGIHVHRRLIRLTLLRRHYDYTIGSQCAIDGGCSSILQHRY